jgi:hypothetical protein
MKDDSKVYRYVLIVFLICLYILTMYVSLTAYRYYQIVAQGLVGLASMYLLFYFVRNSRIDLSLNALLLAPKKTNFFAITFMCGLVFSWATLQFLEMILFFIKR